MVIPARVLAGMWNTAAIGAVFVGAFITIGAIVLFVEYSVFGGITMALHPRLVPVMVAITNFVPLTTWYAGRVHWGRALALLLPGVGMLALAGWAAFVAWRGDERFDVFDAELGIGIGVVLLAPIAACRRGWPTVIVGSSRFARRQVARVHRAWRRRRKWVTVPAGLLAITLVSATLFEAWIIFMIASRALDVLNH